MAIVRLPSPSCSAASLVASLLALPASVRELLRGDVLGAAPRRLLAAVVVVLADHRLELGAQVVDEIPNAFQVRHAPVRVRLPRQDQSDSRADDSGRGR